jgi:hypothetical protein
MSLGFMSSDTELLARFINKVHLTNRGFIPRYLRTERLSRVDIQASLSVDLVQFLIQFRETALDGDCVSEFRQPNPN